MESTFETTLKRIMNGETSVEEEIAMGALRAKAANSNFRHFTSAEFTKTFMPGWQIPVDSEGLTVSHFANQFTLDEWEDDPLPVLISAIEKYNFRKEECYAKLSAMMRLSANWLGKFQTNNSHQPSK